jgi:hypothetical protein
MWGNILTHIGMHHTRLKLKLLCFWIKHQYQTSQEIGMASKPLVQVKLEMISLLQMQKRNENAWASENKDKEPDYTPLNLDTASATNVFDKVKNLLTRVRGITGIPLLYVISILLIPEDKDDGLPFGNEETKCTSIDMEATAQALSFLMTPITTKNMMPLRPMNHLFPPFSLTPRRFGPSSLHVLASQACGNTSRSLLPNRTGTMPGILSTIISLGGDKVNTMCSDILLTRKNLYYSGDCKNFNFDKYCTRHVEQHNHHATFAKHGVTPLEETMKIHYFKDGISDSSFAFVKSIMIMVDRQKFQEFDAVMQLYVNFKHL